MRTRAPRAHTARATDKSWFLGYWMGHRIMMATTGSAAGRQYESLETISPRLLVIGAR